MNVFYKIEKITYRLRSYVNYVKLNIFIIYNK